MSARPNQKRPATSNGGGPSKGPTTKKARFVEPPEDPAAFAEEVDAELEDTKRKGRVRTEGYDSDSTDDGEGVVLSRRVRPDGKNKDGDDDDMFSVDEKEQSEKAGDRKKKKESYLRLGDIEGQEFGAAPEFGSSDEDDPEDEDDAERRKKAGMGYELSSFNMREEMEEGKFAADGTYVRSFDPHGVHDRWMEEIDEKDIKLARRRKKERDRQLKEKLQAEEMELERSGGTVELEKALVSMLKKGESVLEALQRLGAHAKKGKHAHGRNVKSSSGDETMVSTKGKSDIDTITHLASTLLSLGDADIYSKTFEELVRSVRSSGNVEPSWDPPSADVKYEYKWNVTGSAPTDEVFGPFSEGEVKAWFKAAYFGPAGEKVKIRQVGGHWGEWEDVIA